MSINVKKYTKAQMAKMVEDAQAEVQELKRVNATLTEQIERMNGEAITRENMIANLKADADALRVQLKNANDTMEAISKELQRVNSENDALRNKLADTEAELGRANAAVDELKAGRAQQTKEIFEWQQSAQALHDDLLDARDRANYAEAHPWRTLWAWLKRKLKMA